MKATNRDGADAETVVCALFHDVGEVLNHVNHGEIGKYTDEYDGDAVDNGDDDDDVGEVLNHVNHGEIG